MIDLDYLRQIADLIESDGYRQSGEQVRLAADEIERLRAEVQKTLDAGAVWDRAYQELKQEHEHFRAGCNPECPGCGLRPCNEQGAAVLWCDECVGRLRAELSALRAAIVAGGEFSSEQYDGMPTLVILETRWVPVKWHNERIEDLQREATKAQTFFRDAISALRRFSPNGPRERSGFEADTM